MKNRRRFTWILLSQNAHVAGFDGTTLQIGFVNAGARDNFSGSGSEDVLKAALAEEFNVQWKIDAVIDPSGGSAPPAGGGGGLGGGGAYGGGGLPGGGSGFGGGQPGGGPGGGQPGAGPDGGFAGGAPAGGGATAYQRPAPPQQASAPSSAQVQQQAPAPRQDRPAGPPQQAPAPAPEPRRHVAPEDDMPAPDDPDLDESALSGHELIVRELGATVVEEVVHE